NVHGAKALGEAVIFGLESAYGRIVLPALVLKARVQPLHNPLVDFFAEVQPGKKRRERRVNDFLPHIGLGAFPLVAGGVVVNVLRLLDLPDHRTPAMAASDQAGERETARTLAELPTSAIFEAELHALP